MYDPEVSEPLRIDERLVVLAGFLISAGMMACLAASLTWFGELIVAGWDGTYLIVLSFLVALKSLYSHRLLRSQFFTDPVWVSYRVSEWVVILVVLKGVQILDAGSMGIYQEILSWQNNFAQNFFNNETAFGVITLLIVWVASGRFADELVALEANERVLRQEMETGIYEDRGAIRKRLANLILIIGGGMVVLTALQHTNLLENWFDQPLMRASVVNTIFYFILALVLLSLTNFNLVRASWFRDQIIVHKNIAGRWLLYSAVFILALALIARLLPTNYSIGLLTILNYLLFAVLALLNFLVTLLILPVVLLFGWLMSFLINQEGPETGAPLPPTMPESLVFSQNQPVPWVELIKSISLLGCIYWGSRGIVGLLFQRKPGCMGKTSYHKDICPNSALLEVAGRLVSGCRPPARFGGGCWFRAPEGQAIVPRAGASVEVYQSTQAITARSSAVLLSGAGAPGI